MAKKKSKLPKRKKIKVKVDIRTWKGRGWVCQVIENEDGGGWAVTMTREGDSEPAYMGPWTMGRNKIDPKPLSLAAFNTWVKSATEFLARSQYQIRTSDRQAFTTYTESGEKLNVIFDINRGDYESEGVLIAEDAVYGNEIARCTVHPKFKLTIDSATDWINNGFAPPPPSEESVHIAEDDVWDPDAEEKEHEEESFEADYVEEYVEEYEEVVYDYDG